MTQVANPNVTYTYTHDPAHRLRSVTDSRGPKRLTYTYAPGGRRTTVRDSDGGTTSYDYDAMRRLTGIWASNGEDVTLSYDPRGRLTEKAYPNGAVTRFTYNADNTLQQVKTILGTTTGMKRDPAVCSVSRQNPPVPMGMGSR